jgi:putative oxidoreductase
MEGIGPSRDGKEMIVMAIGLLILRVVVGALLVGHGVQKLFSWFGGPGLEGATGFIRSLGYRNARVAALAAGLTETASGVLLAFGFLTPLAVAGIIGIMVNAAATVHRHNGLWNAKGGIELPLVYAVIATSLGFTGAGAFSLDRVLGLHLAGAAYGVGAVALGLAAAMVALAMRTSAGEPEVESFPERIAA